MEILQQAMMNLPDNTELDSKLTVPVEAFENMDTSNNDDSNLDTCDPLDRLMCELVDQLWTVHQIRTWTIFLSSIVQ